MMDTYNIAVDSPNCIPVNGIPDNCIHVLNTFAIARIQIILVYSIFSADKLTLQLKQKSTVLHCMPTKHEFDVIYYVIFSSI